MVNNDTLRRIRYVFDYNDTQMVGIFRLGGSQLTRDQLCNWLKKEEEEEYVVCEDKEFSVFLNGLIIQNRGLKGDSPPKPDERLTNNMVLMKLKIAMDLKSEDVLGIMQLAEFRVSKHELSAFFRKPGHKHFRECLDQFLRSFLNGMKLKYRDKQVVEKAFDWNESEKVKKPRKRFS